MSGGHLLPAANLAEQVGGGIKTGEVGRLVTSTLFPPTCKCWRDYEWWVDTQPVKTCLLLLLLLEEERLLSDGNLDYWDRRQADDVEEEDEVML